MVSECGPGLDVDTLDSTMAVNSNDEPAPADGKGAESFVSELESDAEDDAIEGNSGVVSVDGEPTKAPLQIEDASEVVQADPRTENGNGFYIVNLQSQLLAAVQLKDE